MIPGIEEILRMFAQHEIDQQQALAWIERHLEMVSETEGMRDHFAAVAMQGICAHHDTWGLQVAGIGLKAYEIADAMLKARTE